MCPVHCVRSAALQGCPPAERPTPDRRGSGTVCVNGAAAHLNRPGDLVILATFADMDPEEARQYAPTIVRVDANNRILPHGGPELPGPILDSRRAQA